MPSTTSTVALGSVKSIAQEQGISLAQAFLSVECIIVVDVSGSMHAADSRGGKTRYTVACEELRKLQETMPGRIAVVSFSDAAKYVPSGVPLLDGGGTDLATALRFVHIADGTVRFFVISDGQPNDEAAALAAAKRFKSKIDCIFVGPEGGYGQEFLHRLAKASGGDFATAAQADDLAAVTTRLMIA